MNEDICKVIKYNKYELIFKTNDKILFSNLKKEYKYYYDFIEYSPNKGNLTCVKVIKSEKLFNTNIKRVRNNRISNIYCDVRRNNIIIVDKKNNEVILVYNDYNDEKLQHVEEILVSIFGKKMEEEGITFLHTYCVSKDGNGIAFLKGDNIDNTLLLRLLNDSYGLVTNSKLGMNIDKNEVIGISVPTRLGIKLGNTKNSFLSEKQIQLIKDTIGYKEYFYQEQKKRNFRKENYKFNLTFSDLEKIFHTEIISLTRLKFIIDLRYLPDVKNIRIKKMEKDDIYQSLKKNKEGGTYKPVKYIDKLYSNYHSKNSVFDIIDKNIRFVKVFYNEENCEQLIKILKGRI